MAKEATDCSVLSALGAIQAKVHWKDFKGFSFPPSLDGWPDATELNCTSHLALPCCCSLCTHTQAALDWSTHVSLRTRDSFEKGIRSTFQKMKDANGWLISQRNVHFRPFALPMTSSSVCCYAANRVAVDCRDARALKSGCMAIGMRRRFDRN